MSDKAASRDKTRKLPPVAKCIILAAAYGFVVLRYFVLFWIVARLLHLPYDWPGALLLAVIATITVGTWLWFKKRRAEVQKSSVGPQPGGSAA